MSESKGFIKIDCELDELVIKPDAILLIAETKTKSGLYLPKGSGSEEALDFSVIKVGSNVTEYFVGDKVLWFDRGNTVGWRDKLLTLVDKYSLGLVVREKKDV